jgi:hypothetical protein
VVKSYTLTEDAEMMRRRNIFRVGLAAVVALALLVLVYRTIAFLGAGTGLVASCHEGSADTMLFKIDGSISNVFYHPSNPAPTYPAV